MYISGSSQSGKTYFAEQLLKRNLFQEPLTIVHYRHPDFLETAPVKWHKSLTYPVSYRTGLPSMKELFKLEHVLFLMIYTKNVSTQRRSIIRFEFFREKRSFLL